MAEQRPQARRRHGEPLRLEEAALTSAESGEAPAMQAPVWPFGYIFPELAGEDSKTLAVLKETDVVTNLKTLGSLDIMKDDVEHILGVPIPTAYTFFGQFVDHDITLTVLKPDIDFSDPALAPLPYPEVKDAVWNARSPNLELDSIYGSAPGLIPPRDSNNPEKLRIDAVSEPAGLPPGKSATNDLPRRPSDHVALIGEARNDENIITAQIHVAFLHASTALIDRGYTFAQARKRIIQHYQWIVLEDFLPRVADPRIVRRVKTEGARFFNPSRADFFTPLEFSVAAYRFGHSKVRPFYEHYNSQIESATLDELFVFTMFSGALGGENHSNIIGQWVIDWKNFLNADDSQFFSRPIDTRLSPDLFNLGMEQGALLPDWKKKLAVRNLLRGYILRLLTGQAVANVMNSIDNSIVALTGDQIKSAVTEAQYNLLDQAKFLEHTPLWFYILAEAAYYNKGYHLGPVGSTIVVETLIGILRYSDYSILSIPNWQPTLGLTSGKFDLEDLLILAGVQDPRASS